MLHEVAASDRDLTTIVNPVRKMLHRVHFFTGKVHQIGIEKKIVVVSHGFDHHQHTL
jgi:NADH dehydrogenase